MASENANNSGSRDAESTSENTTLLPPVRRGRAALALSDRYRVVLDEYVAALRSAPLSDQTRRTYESKVRQFLAWLAQADVDGDPLNAADARDWASAVAAKKKRPAPFVVSIGGVDTRCRPGACAKTSQRGARADTRTGAVQGALRQQSALAR